MQYALAAIFGFLIGSFPTGVVLTRKKFGLDVREMGSGNIGATNVTRVFGWYAGVLVFLLDFAKGALPLYLIHHYVPDEPWLGPVAAVALVAGHCFSVFLKGRGGKGVATSLGCLTVVAPIAAAVGAVTYAILLMATRISAVGSLGGLSAVFIYFFFRPATPQIHLSILCIGAIVLVRHIENIKRLWGGSAKMPTE